MAMQIGKREQIVVGVIVAVVAIMAVHLLFFQEKAKDEAQLLGQRKQLSDKFSEVAKVPSPTDLEQYQKETVKNENLLWQVVSDLDILTRAPFTDIPPLPAAAATGPNAAKIKSYHDMLLMRQAVEAQALVATRVERLAEMGKTFEAGEKWVGETGLTPEEAKPGVTKLSFLGDGENGWGLAAGVAPVPSTNAELWDAVDHVYEQWQVLRLLQPSSPNYDPTEEKYKQNLKTLGLDLDAVSGLKAANQFLPEFRKLMLARAIWQKKGADESVQMGQETLSLPLLKEMLTFESPEPGDMYLLYRQLGFLEHLLVLARQSGVGEVDQVELPAGKLVVSYDPASIKAAKDVIVKANQATNPSATPARRRLGGQAGATTPTPVGAAVPPGAAIIPVVPPGAAIIPVVPPGGAPSGAVAPGGAGAPAVATPALTGVKETAFGMVVNMAYTSSNEASMRFLYAISTAPQYYNVEGVTVEAAKEEGQTKVWLTAQALLTAVVPGSWPPEDISKGLLDPETGQPKPLVSAEGASGAALYTKQLEENKARGLDEQAVMVKALLDSGLPEATPTPEVTMPAAGAAPAAPAAGGAAPAAAAAPAPAAAPAAPGAPGAPAAPIAPVIPRPGTPVPK